VKLIYRHYATLYFVFAVDQQESDLGILDLIQGREGGSERWKEGGRKGGREGILQRVEVGGRIKWTLRVEKKKGDNKAYILTFPFPARSTTHTQIVFVEALDKCFENVCELDLIFHSDKVRFY